MSINNMIFSQIKGLTKSLILSSMRPRYPPLTTLVFFFLNSYPVASCYIDALESSSFKGAN